MNKYATTPQGQYHGPLPVRNFFPLPNIIFDLGLTAEEIAVYAFLMKCEDRRTYTCYPSYKTIGDAIGKSRNTVIKYVNMLEEKELITKRKSFVITKDGKETSRMSIIISRCGNEGISRISSRKSAVKEDDYQKQVKVRRPP